MDQLKIPLSFKQSEKYIYDYVKKKLNYSAYVKELILKDMNQDKPKEEKKEKKNIQFDF